MAEWRTSLLSKTCELRFKTLFYGRLAVLILHEVYNGANDKSAIGHTAFIAAAYIAWVGYGAGILAVKDILQMLFGTLVTIGFALYKDS